MFYEKSCMYVGFTLFNTTKDKVVIAKHVLL